MKKITAGTFILFLISFLPVYGQQVMFYENLPKEVRMNLAEGYQAVANRYESLGQTDKAAELRKMAEELSAPWRMELDTDDLLPDDHVDDPILEDIYEQNVNQDRNERDIMTAFNRYKTAFFSEDIDAVMKTITEPFYIPFNEQGMTKEEVREMYQTIFDQYPVNENDPDAVFRADSFVIMELENGYYRVDIQTNDVYDDYFFSIPFWDSFQSYYFVQNGYGEWLLTAVSSTEALF
jgi:hypothetical protein